MNVSASVDVCDCDGCVVHGWSMHPIFYID
jgi:hypothetical protein